MLKAPFLLKCTSVPEAGLVPATAWRPAGQALPRQAEHGAGVAGQVDAGRPRPCGGRPRSSGDLP